MDIALNSSGQPSKRAQALAAARFLLQSAFDCGLFLEALGNELVHQLLPMAFASEVAVLRTSALSILQWIAALAPKVLFPALPEHLFVDRQSMRNSTKYGFYYGLRAAYFGHKYVRSAAHLDGPHL